MRNLRTTSPLQTQSGFSLIEILIGLVIGLLVTLVIMQVFSTFESQKRTTTGAADAQTNGSIALYTIAHELQVAGYGLISGTDPALSCTTINYDATVTDITPVSITDGGNGPGASDTISLSYGDSPFAGVLSQITGVTGPKDVTVANNMACAANDSALIINGTSCDLTSVAGIPDQITVSLNTMPAGTANGNNLACLGIWTQATFRVNPNYNPASPNNAQAYLQRNDSRSVPDIVNIQARYGISGSCSSNNVVQWVDANDASGLWTPAALAANAGNRNLIKAVRIAVVARNGLLEKDPVSADCTSGKGTANRGPCAWDDASDAAAAPKIDLSNDPDYRRYRYRVYETIVPLR
ncbi:MAG: PilW family protein, partial [Gallionella sp.]